MKMFSGRTPSSSALLPRRLQLLALAEVGGEGHHLAAVVGLQPLQDDRGVEAAGIGEHDLLGGRHRGASARGRPPSRGFSRRRQGRPLPAQRPRLHRAESRARPKKSTRAGVRCGSGSSSRSPCEELLVDRGQRLAVDRRLEGAQALVDRQELDHDGPGVDQVLERGAHLVERVQDLVHQPERDGADHDARGEHHVAEDVVDLDVEDARDVEVHVVEVEPEVVPPHVGKERAGGRWVGTGGVVLAIDELLAVGRLDPLVAELEPGQLDADQGEKGGAERRPEQGGHHQRVGRPRRAAAPG